MLVFALLPLAALVLTVCYLFRLGADISDAAIKGSLLWLFAIAVGTELLSLIHGIEFTSLVIVWGLACGSLALLHTRLRAMPRPLAQVLPALSTPWAQAFFCMLAVILAGELVVSFLSVPNTWDSQTYHLARIEHWLQNHSLIYYPTNIEAQLVHPPLAEIVILQFRALLLSDRLDNMVQWLATAGYLLGVGRIAYRLGADSATAMFAAIVAATIPIGILESTSTQNDAVVSCLLVFMVERLLAWQSGRHSVDAIYMSAAAGLALCTKGTAYVIGFPFGLYFIITSIRRHDYLLLFLCLTCLLLPNVGSYLRNFEYCGLPIGNHGQITNNASFGVGPFLTNAVRNLTVNLATYQPAANKLIVIATRDLLRAMALDVNNPDLTLPGEQYYLTTLQNDEVFAGNPVHIFLVAVAICFFVARRRDIPLNQHLYAACIMGGAILFLVVLRWQPYITRLQLPLFVLAAPLVSLRFAEACRGQALILAATTAALSLWALPPLLSNDLRALIGTEAWPLVSPSVFGRLPNSHWLELTFAKQPLLVKQYADAAVFLVDHRSAQLGLITGADDAEYPLWKLIAWTSLIPVRMEHVAAENESARLAYPLGNFSPTALIVTRALRPSTLSLGGKQWSLKFNAPQIGVYERDGE
jgi:hypothetical protein